MKRLILTVTLLALGGCSTFTSKDKCPDPEEVCIIDALFETGCVIRDYKHELKRSVVQITCRGGD